MSEHVLTNLSLRERTVRVLDLLEESPLPSVTQVEPRYLRFPPSVWRRRDNEEMT